MKSLTIAVTLVLAAAALADDAKDAKPAPAPGAMKLLPGYTHEPLQGIDSIVGRIVKKGGLMISYEIGAVTAPGAPQLGGGFTDRPKLMPAKDRQWYKEQTISGQPMHVALAKNDVLYVSFPQKGMNFHLQVKTLEDLTDALLMIATYPAPPAPPAPAK